MKTLIFPFFLAVAVALLNGCAGASASLAPNEDKLEQVIEYHSLQIRSQLAITAMRQRKVGDLLQVGVDLTNRWDQSLQFQYQFHFYDKDGFEVGSEGRPWTPIVISGKSTQSVQATAPNPSAVKFKVMVKN